MEVRLYIEMIVFSSFGNEYVTIAVELQFKQL